MNTRQLDLKVCVQGIRVVADIEEGLGDAHVLENRPEGAPVRADGGESALAERVDVDEVEVVCRESEEFDDGDGAVAGEVDAFEVEVEGRRRGGKIYDGVEHGGH